MSLSLGVSSPLALANTEPEIKTKIGITQTNSFKHGETSASSKYFTLITEDEKAALEYPSSIAGPNYHYKKASEPYTPKSAPLDFQVYLQGHKQTTKNVIAFKKGIVQNSANLKSLAKRLGTSLFTIEYVQNNLDPKLKIATCATQFVIQSKAIMDSFLRVQKAQREAANLIGKLRVIEIVKATEAKKQIQSNVDREIFSRVTDRNPYDLEGKKQLTNLAYEFKLTFFRAAKIVKKEVGSDPNDIRSCEHAYTSSNSVFVDFEKEANQMLEQEAEYEATITAALKAEIDNNQMAMKSYHEATKELNRALGSSSDSQSVHAGQKPESTEKSAESSQSKDAVAAESAEGH